MQNIFLGLEIELAGFPKQPSPRTLSDVLSQLETVLPTDIAELPGHGATDLVRVELWNIDEVLPVLRFSRDTEDTVQRSLSSHAEIRAELRRWLSQDESLSLYSLFPDVTDYFKPLDAANEKWNTDDLLAGEHSPVSRPGIIGTSTSHSLEGETSDIMQHIARCGTVAAANHLARGAAAWTNGPVGAEESNFDMWHVRGTSLVKTAGQISIASRCLGADENDIRRLSVDVISLVPSLQQTFRQDRIHGLVQKEKTRAEAEKLAHDQQKIEDRRREIKASILKASQSIELAKQKIIDRRGQRLVAVGSIAAFMLTTVALLPAFGALKQDDIQALLIVARDAWGATLLGVGLAFLVFLIGGVANWKWSERELAAEREKLDAAVTQQKNELAELAARVPASALDESAGPDVADPVTQTDGAKDATAVADQQSEAEPARQQSVRGRRNKQRFGTSAAERVRASKPSNSKSKPETAPATSAAERDEPSSPAFAGPVYQIRVSVGALARGQRSEMRFRVEEGSHARVEDQGSITDLVRRLRAELVKQGVLVKTPDDATYKFTRSFVFESMSAAAAVVLGRGVSGDDEWTERRSSAPAATHDLASSTSQEASLAIQDSDLVAVSLTVPPSGLQARGVYNRADRRLTVRAGSMASRTTRDTLSAISQGLRREALRSGALQKDAEGQSLHFQKDMTFDRPQQAAEIISGYSLSGCGNWLVEETGERLETITSVLDEPANPEKVQVPSGYTLRLTGPDGVDAQGKRKENGELLVLAGARARLVEVKSIPPQVSKKRTELIELGHLEEQGDAYVLRSDYSFPNPSIAAGVFLGRSANGHSTWKSGEQTLGQLLNG